MLVTHVFHVHLSKTSNPFAFQSIHKLDKKSKRFNAIGVLQHIDVLNTTLI